MASLAPRPLQMLLEDQGTDFEPAATDLRARYRTLGVPERLSMETARTGQDWPKAHRLATVNWFRRWLSGKEGTLAESEVVAEKYASLNATPNGSLRDAKLGKSIYSIIAGHARDLPPLRTPSGADMAQVRSDIRKLIASPEKPVPLNPREISSDRLEGYWLSQVEFLAEPGIYVSAMLYRPARPNGECIVYVEGEVTTLAPDADDDAPAKPNHDERESGETSHKSSRARVSMSCGRTSAEWARLDPSRSRRDLRGPWEHLHGSDVALANMAWAAGRLPARDARARCAAIHRVRRSIRQSSRGGSGYGRDMGAVRGSAHRKVSRISIQRGLASYRMLLDHGRYSQAVSQFVPGVLRQFDLPQVAGAIAPRKLTIVDPTDHLNKPLAAADAERAYSWTQLAYTTAKSADDFEIVCGEELGGLVNHA